MTPTRLQQINEYVTPLFEALFELDLDSTSQEIELPILKDIITELQTATYDNPNHPNLGLIAKLGLDSLKCYTCIIKQMLPCFYVLRNAPLLPQLTHWNLHIG